MTASKYEHTAEFNEKAVRLAIYIFFFRFSRIN
ncbi:hypothetical protein ACVWZX_004562 [Deinococcus sp. UYEF24]